MTAEKDDPGTVLAKLMVKTVIRIARHYPQMIAHQEVLDRASQALKDEFPALFHPERRHFHALVVDRRLDPRKEPTPVTVTASKVSTSASTSPNITVDLEAGGGGNDGRLWVVNGEVTELPAPPPAGVLRIPLGAPQASEPPKSALDQYRQRFKK